MTLAKEMGPAAILAVRASMTYSLRKSIRAKLRTTRTNYPRRKATIRTDDVFAWCGVIRGGVVAAW